MALESGEFITDLIIANPTATDFINEGDDHLRLVKKVLQQSFPNVNAAVVSTPDDLNNGIVPVGGIIMWTGLISNLPSGWALCNGSNGTPNLQSRFIMASTGDAGGNPTDSTGGSNDAVVVLHDHGADGSPNPLVTVLHNHGAVITAPTVPTGQGAAFEPSGQNYPQGSSQNATAEIEGRVRDQGVSGVDANIPLYYALAMVQRTI